MTLEEQVRFGESLRKILPAFVPVDYTLDINRRAAVHNVEGPGFHAETSASRCHRTHVGRDRTSQLGRLEQVHEIDQPEPSRYYCPKPEKIGTHCECGAPYAFLERHGEWGYTCAR